MRHKKKFNHLSRKSAHRKAMLSNMATSLIMHKRIHTTLAKAKALRVYVEPLITKSKDDSTHSRRVVFSYLQSKEAVTELFREVAPKVAERPGGYTRIIKLPNRLGDNAEMCMIELVDFNENLLKETKATTKKRRRRGGGGAKATVPAAEVTTEKKEEVVEEEVKPTDEGKQEVDAVVEEEKTETSSEVKEEPAKEELKVEETAPEEDQKDDKNPLAEKEAEEVKDKKEEKEPEVKKDDDKKE